MDCNNIYCYWQSFNQCCHESEEGFNNATPNKLDCPSSLRKDFHLQMYNLLNEIVSMLERRNMKELIQIKRFVENQRMNCFGNWDLESKTCEECGDDKCREHTIKKWRKVND